MWGGGKSELHFPVHSGSKIIAANGRPPQGARCEQRRFCPKGRKYPIFWDKPDGNAGSETAKSLLGARANRCLASVKVARLSLKAILGPDRWLPKTELGLRVAWAFLVFDFCALSVLFFKNFFTFSFFGKKTNMPQFSFLWKLAISAFLMEIIPVNIFKRAGVQNLEPLLEKKLRHIFYAVYPAGYYF